MLLYLTQKATAMPYVLLPLPPACDTPEERAGPACGPSSKMADETPVKPALALVLKYTHETSLHVACPSVRSFFFSRIDRKKEMSI